MKYGLLYYKNTDNIGDDIQSYAQEQFLPRIDYMIDRENLEQFVPNEKEYVYTIMNAWYIHDKYNFNFSPYIYPLFISMFFKNFPYEDGVTYGTDYLNENVITDLKKYSPVGARDLHTKKIFDNLNIENYFSGCLTLTIEKFPNIKKGKYIVVNGLNEEEIEYIKSKTKKEVKVVKQDVPYGSFSNETWEQRKKRVIDLLKLYQGAHMVITTKLHCSLPCLAIETPVLLLYDKSFPENEDRIGTYLEYLNHIDRTELKSSNINFNKPLNNPEKYLELRKSLIKKCKEFINNNKQIDINDLPDIEQYKYYIKRSFESRKPIINHLKELSNKYVEECKKSSQMFDELNELRYQNNELKNDIDNLKDNNEKLNKEKDEINNKYNNLNERMSRIENSRSYKLYKKIKKVLK